MHPVKDGTLAQLVEQRTENPCVPGSIPGGTTKRNLLYFSKLRFFLYKKSHFELTKWLFYSFKKYYCATSFLQAAFINSLFKRAMFVSEIPLGHSTSQAPVLVQFPKPSKSI